MLPTRLNMSFVLLSILGYFTSANSALFSKGIAGTKGMSKIRKFKPIVIKDELAKQIRSVLEFSVTAEDHGAVYKCRAFAQSTMSVPQESALKAAFNVTCKC